MRVRQQARPRANRVAGGRASAHGPTWAWRRDRTERGLVAGQRRAVPKQSVQGGQHNMHIRVTRKVVHRPLRNVQRPGDQGTRLLGRRLAQVRWLHRADRLDRVHVMLRCSPRVQAVRRHDLVHHGGRGFLQACHHPRRRHANRFSVLGRQEAYHQHQTLGRHQRRHPEQRHDAPTSAHADSLVRIAMAVSGRGRGSARGAPPPPRAALQAPRAQRPLPCKRPARFKRTTG